MDKQSFIFKFAFAPALCWGILIAYFSLMPGNEVPGLLKNMQDSGLHFSIYAVFGMLLYFAHTSFQLQSIPNYNSWVIFLFGSMLGLVIELIQENFVVGRTFQWSDFVANTTGSSIMFVVNFIAKKSKTKTTKI